MILNKTTQITLAAVFFLVMSMPTFAQPGNEAPDDEDAEGEVPVPISDYVVPMLILGIATSFVLLRKTKEKSRFV